MRRSFVGAGIFALLMAFWSNSAAAQSDNYYAGKTLRVLVGLQVGGTADTAVRMFSEYLHRHLAGKQSERGTGPWPRHPHNGNRARRLAR